MAIEVGDNRVFRDVVETELVNVFGVTGEHQWPEVVSMSVLIVLIKTGKHDVEVVLR